MSGAIDVLCVGEGLVVLSALGEIEIETADHWAVSVGGAEANVAIALARAGRRVEWASRVGADPVGRRVRRTLAAEGVGVTCADEGDGTTGMYIKTGTGPLYYRAGSPASRLDAEAADRWAAALCPRVVHVTGVLAMLSPAAERLARRIIIDRVFGEALVTFDVNARPALATTQTPGVLADLAKAADVVFVGRDEAAGLWGTTDAESIRRVLPAVPELVVKDADIEAVSFRGAQVTRVPATQVDIVEPTGAGDAFAAGWIAAWLDGLGAKDRLARAHRGAREALLSAGDVANSGQRTR